MELARLEFFSKIFFLRIACQRIQITFADTLIEADNYYLLNRINSLQALSYLHNGNLRGLLNRKTICSSANGWKGYGPNVIMIGQFKAAPIAASEGLIFTIISTLPNWTYSMNHVLGREIIAASDPGLAGRAPIQFAAFFKQTWTGCPVNCAVHATAAQQGAIGGIDYGVNGLPSNISFFNRYFVQHI